MKKISAAAAELGRKGGKSTSQKKKDAVRKNGTLGGRPLTALHYYTKGTLNRGQFIAQQGWEWANDLSLTGEKTSENEIGTCSCLSTAEWKQKGYRQVSRAKAEALLISGGFSELPESWFPQN